MENGKFLSILTEKNEDLELSLIKSDFRIQNPEVGNFDDLEEEFFRGEVLEKIDSKLFEEKIINQK